MKISLALGQRRPLDKTTAWGCLTANVAVPGSGSLIAGRASGYFQMLVAMIGMVLTTYFGIKFIVWYVSIWAHMQETQPDLAANFEQLWLRLRWFLLGVTVFGVGWFWALGSSLHILFESKKTPASAPPVMNK